MSNFARYSLSDAANKVWFDADNQYSFPTREFKLVPGEKFMPVGVPELMALSNLSVEYTPGGWHQGARRRGKWRMWKPGAALFVEYAREGDPAEHWIEAIKRVLDHYHAKQVQHSDDHA